MWQERETYAGHFTIRKSSSLYLALICHKGLTHHYPQKIMTLLGHYLREYEEQSGTLRRGSRGKTATMNYSTHKTRAAVEVILFSSLTFNSLYGTACPLPKPKHQPKRFPPP